MYVPLTSSVVFSLTSALYITANPGYDDKMMRNCKSSKKTLVIESGLSCRKLQKSTSKKRFEIVCFYQSIFGQYLQSERNMYSEPLIEHQILV